MGEDNPLTGRELPAANFTPVRVLLVDDHEMVRKGLRTLLKTVLSRFICDETSDGEQAVEKAIELKPDLILMDVRMPVMNGIDATRQIRRYLPNTKIVVLTMHDSAQMADQAQKAGASAYVLKSDSPEVLRQKIAEVLTV